MYLKVALVAIAEIFMSSQPEAVAYATLYRNIITNSKS